MTYRPKPPLLPLDGLSDQEKYRQVKNFTSLTKATSPYYTSLPEHQPMRWHLWFDGRTIVSLLCEGNGPTRTWSEGPLVTVQGFTTGEGLVESAIGILAGSYGKKPKGLGVIVHMADCPSLNVAADKFDNLDKFAEVSDLAIDDPRQVILGLSADAPVTSRWRAFPVIAAKTNKIVFFRLAISDMGGLGRLNDIDAPITLSVRCAQAEAIVVTQRLVEGIMADTQDGSQPAQNPARIIIIHYRKVTVMSLYDEKGVPVKVRHLPHADGKISDQLLEEYAQLIKLAPMGVKDLLVTIFSFVETQEDEVSPIEDILNTNQPGSSSLNITLQSMPRELMPNLLESMGIGVSLGSGLILPAECVTEYDTFLLTGTPGLGRKNVDFMLRASKDNYIDESTALRAATVQEGDVRLMLLCRYARRASIILVACLFGFFGFKAFGILKSDSWTANPENFAASTEKLADLQKEQTYNQRVAAALAPTCTVWQNMELILALFPESHDLVLTDMHFTVDPQTGGQKWAITGYANESGIATLRTLQNPQLLEATFEKIAKTNQAWTYLPGSGKTRTLSVREENNSTFTTPNATTPHEQYPLRFTVDLLYSGDYTPPGLPSYKLNNKKEK